MGLRARRLGSLENRKDTLESPQELYLEWEAGNKHGRKNPEFRTFMRDEIPMHGYDPD